LLGVHETLAILDGKSELAVGLNDLLGNNYGSSLLHDLVVTRAGARTAMRLALGLLDNGSSSHSGLSKRDDVGLLAVLVNNFQLAVQDTSSLLLALKNDVDRSVEAMSLDDDLGFANKRILAQVSTVLDL